MSHLATEVRPAADARPVPPPATAAPTSLRVPLALFAVALVARVFLAFALPLWQSPDEPKHFEHARMLRDLRGTLVEERRLLNLKDASPALQTAIIASLERNRFWAYLNQPEPKSLPKTFYDLWQGKAAQLHRHSLYYFLAAAAILPLHPDASPDLDPASIERELRVVRLVSALLSALAVPITWLAARRVTPEDPFVPFAAAAFVALLPMHVAIGGSANTDNLATLSGALFALAIAQALSRGIRLVDLGVALIAVLLTVASKRTGLGLLPLLPLLSVFWLFRQRGRALAASIGALGAVAGLAVAVVMSYPREIDRLAASIGGYFLNEPDQAARFLRVVSLTAPETWRLVVDHQVMFFKSFWGVFGWFAVPLPESTYRDLAYATVACALGLGGYLAYLLYRACRADARAGRRLLVLATFALSVLLITVFAEAERLSYFSAGEIPQGRYLYLVVTEVAVLLALGLRTLLPRKLLGTRLPSALCLAALVALDASSCLTSLGPGLLWKAVGQ
jgi:4-amino-4-deoxy-L-arabinose transferase-like glycosyltransferase